MIWDLRVVFCFVLECRQRNPGLRSTYLVTQKKQISFWVRAYESYGSRGTFLKLTLRKEFPTAIQVNRWSTVLPVTPEVRDPSSNLAVACCASHAWRFYEGQTDNWFRVIMFFSSYGDVIKSTVVKEVFLYKVLIISKWAISVFTVWWTRQVKYIQSTNYQF